MPIYNLKSSNINLCSAFEFFLKYDCNYNYDKQDKKPFR